MYFSPLTNHFQFCFSYDVLSVNEENNRNSKSEIETIAVAAHPPCSGWCMCSTFATVYLSCHGRFTQGSLTLTDIDQCPSGPRNLPFSFTGN